MFPGGFWQSQVIVHQMAANHPVAMFAAHPVQATLGRPPPVCVCVLMLAVLPLCGTPPPPYRNVIRRPLWTGQCWQGVVD